MVGSGFRRAGVPQMMFLAGDPVTAGQVCRRLVRKSMLRSRFAVGAALLLLGTWTAAAPGANIHVGRVVVKPDTPGQVVPVSVAGGEPIAAVELYAQIGDGGAFNGGSAVRPVFQGADLVSGTLF